MEDETDSTQGSPKSVKSSKRNSESEEENEVSKKPCVASPSRGDISPSLGSQSSTLHPRYNEDFDEIDLLGKGGFGIVFECRHKLDGQKYAVKKIPFGDHQRDRFLREANIMAKVQHPSIVRYHQCWIEDEPADVGSVASEEEIDGTTKTLFIVMELCRSPMTPKMRAGIDEYEVFRYCREILEGLSFLHDRGYIHGDLSRDNIFLDLDGHAKIGDFGLARESGEDTMADEKSLPGNPMYRAPEICHLCPSSQKADLYAFGLLLFEMSYHMESDSERSQQFDLVKKLKDVTGVKGFVSFREMIVQLLDKDPEQRPSASELIARYLP